MKTWFGFCLLVLWLASLTFLIEPVAANPHGTYLSSTSSCTRCHLVHKAFPGETTGTFKTFPEQAFRPGIMKEETDTSITYSGTWQTVNRPTLSGGQSRESSDTDAKASFNFYSSTIRWLATKSPDSGVAKVLLNDTFIAYIDLYSADETDRAEVFKFNIQRREMYSDTTEATSSNLPLLGYITNYPLKLAIQATGQKNSSSTGHTISVDAFDVTPEKTQLLHYDKEKSICYTCHNGSGSATNIQAEFGDDGTSTPKTSRHPVPQGELACSDCHTPHKKPDNNDTTYEPNEVVKLLRVIWQTFFGFVVNPDSTAWQDLPGDPRYAALPQKRLDNSNMFCGGCHGSGSSLRGGDVLTYYLNSAHDSSVTATSLSGIKCLACHSRHASDLPALLETTISGSPLTGNDNSVCDACHDLAPILPNYTTTESYGDKHGAAESSQTTSTPGLKSPYYYRYPKMDCKTCHDPHNKLSVYMIRETVNDTAVLVTSETDDAGIKEFCAACHTKEDNRPNCLGCHFHGAGADTDTTTAF